MRALLLLLLLGGGAAAHRGHPRRNLFGRHFLSHAKEAEHAAEHGFHEAKSVAKDVVHDAEKWTGHQHDDHHEEHVEAHLPASPRKPPSPVEDAPATAVAVSEPAQEPADAPADAPADEDVTVAPEEGSDSPELFEALGAASPLVATLLGEGPIDVPNAERIFDGEKRRSLAHQEIRRHRHLAAQDLLPPASAISAVAASQISGISGMSAISAPQTGYMESDTVAMSRASNSEIRSMAAYRGYGLGNDQTFFGAENQYVPTFTAATMDMASGINSFKSGGAGRYDDEMIFGLGVSGGAESTDIRPDIPEMADAVMSGDAEGLRSDLSSTGSGDNMDVAGGGSSGSGGLATSTSFREDAAMAMDPASPVRYRPLQPPMQKYVVPPQRPSMLRFLFNKALASGIGFVSGGSEDSSASSSTTLTTTSDTDGGAMSSFSDISAMSSDSDADVAGSGRGSSGGSRDSSGGRGSALLLREAAAVRAFDRAVDFRLGVIQFLAAVEAAMGPSPGEEMTRPLGCGGYMRLELGSGAGGIGFVDIGSSGGGGHGSGGFSEMSRSSDSDSTSDDWSGSSYSSTDTIETSSSDPLRAALSAVAASEVAETMRAALVAPNTFAAENIFAETSFADKYSDDGITVEGGTICRCANGKWNIFVEPELLDAPSACPRLCGDIDASEIDSSNAERSIQAELAMVFAMVAATVMVVLTAALVATALFRRAAQPGDQDNALDEPLLEPVAGTVGGNDGSMTPQTAFASAPADPVLV